MRRKFGLGFEEAAIEVLKNADEPLRDSEIVSTGDRRYALRKR
jgi:hypothetical protein